MTTYLRQIHGQPTPQSEKLPGREDEMVMNRAGGAVFAVDDFIRLRRFLVGFDISVPQILRDFVLQ